MRGPKYRLSPNEVEQLVKEDRERRRKQRIVQVREQARASAAAIRNDVRKEKARLLNNFTAEVKHQLEAEKEEKVRKLEQKYENTLRTIGEGHREAFIHGDGESHIENIRQQKRNEAAAKERYERALEQQRVEQAEKEYEQTKHILARYAALEKEKERSAAVAALPPPPPDPCESLELDHTKKKSIPMVDMKAFATTHYHIPDYQIVKATSEEQKMYDGRSLGEETDLKLKQDLAEMKRVQHERIVRARIRGNQALEKEILKHDMGDMLKDLSLLQKQDRRRRQAILDKVPLQVFVPPELCLQEREEKQLAMERDFDHIYLHHVNVQGSDLIGSFNVSDQPGASILTESVDGTGQDSSLATVEASIPVSRINPALRDLTNLSQPKEIIPGQKPETVLKQLLNRIKEQRDGSTVPDRPQPVPSAHQKVSFDTDSQSAISAESRADWQKAEDEELYTVPTDARKSAAIIPDHIMKEANDKVLEELRKVQGKGIFQESPPLRSPTPTLEEVDISHMGHPEEKEVWSKYGQQFNSKSKDGRYVQVLPPDAMNPAMPSLRPIISEGWKGVGSPQYDLLASNGFLPMPAATAPSCGGENMASPRSWEIAGLERAGGDVEFSRKPELEGHTQAGMEKRGSPASVSYTGDIMSKFASSKGMSDRESTLGGLSVDRGDAGSTVESVTAASDKDEDLARRVKAYMDEAGARAASMDESTVRRVREYQQHLLLIHQQRKKMLDDVRADIERRRQELYASTAIRPPLGVSSSGEGQSLFQQWSLGGQTVETQIGAGSGGVASQDTDGKGLEFKHWRPIKPFIADPARKIDHAKAWLGDGGDLTQPQHIQSRKLPQLSGDHSTLPAVASQSKVDKIRKSLSFDDAEESMNVSHVSWGDGPNDVSHHSHATLDESSHLTSSEEERGSPLLPQSRSEKSEISDKSTNSLGGGSSSLNGSALVARAESRRLGFERRQEELQQQLMDIQQQKDSILQRYYDGQRALQEQQTALRSKLGAAVTQKDGGEDRGLESGASQKKIVGAQSRLEQTWGQVKSGLSHKAAGIEDSCATSDRQSLDSLGTPGNISSESYLAEISYHKIKSTEYNQPLPASAFTTKNFGGTSFSDSQEAGDQGRRPQTWGALLSSAQAEQEQIPPHQIGNRYSAGPGSLSEMNPAQLSKDNSGESSQHSSYISRGKTTGLSLADRSSGSSVEKSLGSTMDKSLGSDMSESSADVYSPTELKEETPGDRQGSRRTPPPLSATAVNVGLVDHRPHELSTILEVDTPTSSSVRKSGSAVGTLAQGGSMSQSLSSLTSGSSAMGSHARLDVFAEPPHTFSLGAGSNRFNLAAPWEDTKQKGAKRTLDFSQGQEGGRLRDQGEFGSSGTLGPDEGTDEDVDIMSIPMPDLVELTPLKTRESPTLSENLGTDEGDLSSFRVSGFSDYMREMRDQEKKDESPALTKEAGAEAGRDVTNVLNRARELDPAVMLKLQEQSKAVFGQSEKDSTWASELSSDGSGLPSMNLEEISITDISKGLYEEEEEDSDSNFNDNN